MCQNWSTKYSTKKKLYCPRSLYPSKRFYFQVVFLSVRVVCISSGIKCLSCSETGLTAIQTHAFLYAKGNCALTTHFFCCGCAHSRKWKDISRAGDKFVRARSYFRLISEIDVSHLPDDEFPPSVTKDRGAWEERDWLPVEWEEREEKGERTLTPNGT